MKGIYTSVFVIVVLAANSFCFPNQRPARIDFPGWDDSLFAHSSVEEYDTPAAGSDTDGQNFNPFAYAPLSSFVQSMQAMMKKVQMQMGEVLKRMPPQEIDWGKLGNVTSRTKVVNGHRITINETTYSNKDLNSAGAVFHVRVVDVKPEDTHTTPDVVTADHASNELPEPTQMEDEHEKFSYNFPENQVRVERKDSDEYDRWQPDSINEVDNSIEVFKPIQPYDLSGDTRVNNLIRDQAKKGGLVMIDPDAELIDVIDGEVRKTYYPHQSIYDQQRQQPIFP